MKGQTKLMLGVAGIVAGSIARKAWQESRESEIAGDVVLITGGSRGLGLALARQFASKRAKIAICARDEEDLALARADLSKRGASVFAVRCDVSDREDVHRMLDQVRAHYGRIDILVNNAGEIQVGPIDTASIADFEEAIGTMFWGVVYPTMALLPEFRARGKGRIVNITSIGGKVAVPHLLPYTSAKFAAVGFSEGLRSELANTGVYVTTIAPGLMRTGSYTAAKYKGDPEAESELVQFGREHARYVDGRRQSRSADCAGHKARRCRESADFASEYTGASAWHLPRLKPGSPGADRGSSPASRGQ